MTDEQWVAHFPGLYAATSVDYSNVDQVSPHPEALTRATAAQVSPHPEALTRATPARLAGSDGAGSGPWWPGWQARHDLGSGPPWPAHQLVDVVRDVVGILERTARTRRTVRR
jgi:hypothetical protein